MLTFHILICLIVLTVSLRSKPLGLLSKTTLSTEQALHDGSLRDSAAGDDSKNGLILFDVCAATIFSVITTKLSCNKRGQWILDD